MTPTFEASRQYQLAVEFQRHAHQHGSDEDIEHAELEAALAHDRLVAAIATEEAAKWPDGLAA